jgi:hypothetical protein
VFVSLLMAGLTAWCVQRGRLKHLGLNPVTVMIFLATANP